MLKKVAVLDTTILNLCWHNNKYARCILQKEWMNTGYTQKNGAVSKVNKKFISHLTRAQRTPSAAATVQVSHALPAVLFSCLLRGKFPRWRRSRKRLSVCSVLRCPDPWLQCSVSFVQHGLEKTHHAWCVFSKQTHMTSLIVAFRNPANAPKIVGCPLYRTGFEPATTRLQTNSGTGCTVCRSAVYTGWCQLPTVKWRSASDSVHTVKWAAG